MSINFIQSDTDRKLQFPYHINLRIQTIIEQLVKQNNFSERIRLLHKGQQLNQHLDQTVKELNIQKGDTIIILNHLKHNHIDNKLNEMKYLNDKQQDSYQQMKKQQFYQDLKEYELSQEKQKNVNQKRFQFMDFFTRSSMKKSNSQIQQDQTQNSNSSSNDEFDFNIGKNKKQQSESEIPTPELVAEITGAKEIMKPNKKQNYLRGGIFSNRMNIFDSENPIEQIQELHHMIQLLQESQSQTRENIFNQIRESNESNSRDLEERNQRRIHFMEQLQQQRQRNQELNPVHIKNLVEMGFPEERVKKVLKHFKNSFEMAMDHLINAGGDDILGDSSQQQQEFTPNSESLNMLMEMGYQKEDCIYALKVTSNNLEHSITFLLQNPNPLQSVRSRQGQERIFMNPFVALNQRQENPTVQISFSNQPRNQDMIQPRNQNGPSIFNFFQRQQNNNSQQ